MARFAASVITWQTLAAASTAHDVAFDAIDASSPRRRSATPDAHRESAIQRGLKKRLEQLADERERRQRAAEKADEEFSLEFLNAQRPANPLRHRPETPTMQHADAPESSRTSAEARRRPWRHRHQPTAPLAGRASVFQMIDDDESGTLEKPEIVEAIQG